MKKSIKLLSVAVIGMFVLGGCGKAAVSNQEGSASSTSNQEAEVASMVTVNDTDGEVEVPLNPQKVVVFDMGSLDTINSLGKGDNVIGVPTKNLPAYLTSFSDRESAGGIKEPDLEKINQLQPDLIIISGRQADFKKELSAIAPTLYLAVDNADSWNSTKKNIETLGTIFEEEGTAKTKILELETAIAAVREKAENSGLKTLITLVNEGQLSAYGAGSRFGIIHDTFGFTAADSAIEVSTHGQSASFEYVLEKNPDIIFVIDRTKAVGGDDENNDVTKNELVAETKAGKTNKIISLTADVWYLSGGGIDCTKLMLEDVSKALD